MTEKQQEKEDNSMVDEGKLALSAFLQKTVCVRGYMHTIIQRINVLSILLELDFKYLLIQYQN